MHWQEKPKGVYTVCLVPPSYEEVVLEPGDRLQVTDVAKETALVGRDESLISVFV